MILKMSWRPDASAVERPLKPLGLCLVAISLVVAPSFAASMEWIPVGNPGNDADATGFGAVAHNYQIGKYEVTNAQYAEFLNRVAAADPFNLYDAAMANHGIQQTATSAGFVYATTVADGVNWAAKPVNAVSWYDAIRFSNWMHNGKGAGDTENGAYTLLDGTPTPSNAAAIVRNPGAIVWLPSLDEWYKAAYYNPIQAGGPDYSLYPTGADTAPSNELVSPDPGNNANILGGDLTSTLKGDVKITDVGAFANSASHYGTFDQGGNLAEWSDTLVPGAAAFRASLGGSWGSLATVLQSSNAKFAFNAPAANSIRAGFRVAAIPEPSAMLLAAMAGGGAWLKLRRRQSHVGANIA